MTFGLTQEVIKQINHVFSEHESVQQVIIYGSRAMGNYKRGSDIDLTLIGDAISYEELMKISVKLDELFIPYIVDISVFSQIDSPDLREHIKRVGKLFYHNLG